MEKFNWVGLSWRHFLYSYETFLKLKLNYFFNCHWIKRIQNFTWEYFLRHQRKENWILSLWDILEGTLSNLGRKTKSVHFWTLRNQANFTCAGTNGLKRYNGTFWGKKVFQNVPSGGKNSSIFGQSVT